MFNLPNPGSNPANPFYHRTLEEQRRILNEAVTVELDFKSDAEGKKAGGTMVRKGVYKMTFKNNDEMNKFMDTHADKLNEGTEELEEGKIVFVFDIPKYADAFAKRVKRDHLASGVKRSVDRSSAKPKEVVTVIGQPNAYERYTMRRLANGYDGEFFYTDLGKEVEKMMREDVQLDEGTPAYRKMMQRYKGSDAEKVFKMLRAKGYKVGEQDDTLVQNLLKRHRGNVKKVVDQIVKDYPGKFDVERMMMDHVEIDEEKKLDSRGLGVTRQSGLGSKKVSGEKARKKKLDSRGLGVSRQSGLGSKKEDFEIDEAKATARNIVKGLGDADGPFTVVAMKRDKVIKQETTKRRDMLPAIISTMRKEVGSGVTIAIEDKKGTIRNTFKESVQKVFNNLNDYLAEGSE